MRTQELLVVYVGELLADIAPFPRFHLRQHHYNRMRVYGRKTSLLSDGNPERCGPTDIGKGQSLSNQYISTGFFIFR